MPKFNPGSNCGCCGCLSPAWIAHHNNVSPKYHVFDIGLVHCTASFVYTVVPLFYYSEAGSIKTYRNCQYASGVGIPYQGFTGVIELNIDFTSDSIDGIFLANTWIKKARVVNLSISGGFSSYSSPSIYSRIETNQVLEFTSGQGVAFSPIYCNSEFSGHLPGWNFSYSGVQDWQSAIGSISINPYVSMVYPTAVSGKVIVVNGITGYFSYESIYDCTYLNGGSSTGQCVSGDLDQISCGNCWYSKTSFYDRNYTVNTIFGKFFGYALGPPGIFYDYPSSPCSGSVCDGITENGFATNLAYCNAGNFISSDINSNPELYTETRLTTCECEVYRHYQPSGTQGNCYIYSNVTGALSLSQCGFGYGTLFNEEFTQFRCGGPDNYQYVFDNYAVHQFSGHRLPNKSFSQSLYDINYSMCSYLPHSGTYNAIPSVTGKSCYGLAPENPVLGWLFLLKQTKSGYNKYYSSFTSGCTQSFSIPYSSAYSPILGATPCLAASCPGISGEILWHNYNISGYELNEYALYIGNNYDGRHIFGDIESGNFFKATLPTDDYIYNIDLGTEVVSRCYVQTSTIPCLYIDGPSELELEKKIRIGRYGKDSHFNYSFVALSVNPLDSCEA